MASAALHQYQRSLQGGLLFDGRHNPDQLVAERLRPPITGHIEEVLGMDEPDHLIRRAVLDQDPGVAAGIHQIEHLVYRGLPLHRHDPLARHHHGPHRSSGQLQRARQQRPVELV